MFSRPKPTPVRPKWTLSFSRLFLIIGLALPVAEPAHATPEYRFSRLAGSFDAPGFADGTGSAARFSHPVGVSSDRHGNIYVADSGNRRIRKITPAGVVTTLAGSGAPESRDGEGLAAAFTSPEHLAVGPDGTVYVVDVNAIRKIRPDGVVLTVTGRVAVYARVNGSLSEARFYDPRGIAVDEQGNIYVGDNGGPCIRRISTDGRVTTLAGGRTGPRVDGTGEEAVIDGWIQDIDLGPDGALYVITSSGSVKKVTKEGVVTTLLKSAYDDGGGADNPILYPNGIEVDASGNVFVGDAVLGKVLKISPTGAVTEYAGSGVAGNQDGTFAEAQFSSPWGITMDQTGSLIVSDQDTGTIRRLTPGGSVTTLAGPASSAGQNKPDAQRIVGVNGLAIDKNDTLYVTGDNVVRTISPSGAVTLLSGSPGTHGYVDGLASVARFGRITCIAVDKDRNAYVYDAAIYKLRKVAPDGTTSTLAGGEWNAPFAEPMAMVVDPAGNVIVADRQARCVWKVSPQGVVQRGWGDDTYINPVGLAYDRGGRLHVLAGDGYAALYRCEPDGSLTLVNPSSGVGGDVDGPSGIAAHLGGAGMAFSPSGDLYLPSYNYCTLRVLKQDGSIVTVAGNRSAGTANGVGWETTFFLPHSVVFDRAGNVFVADAVSVRKGIPTGQKSAARILSQPRHSDRAGAHYSSLEVVAVGAYGYQWYKEGKAIEGSIRPTLILSDDWVGIYHVVVSGEGPSVRSEDAVVSDRTKTRLVNISTRAVVASGSDLMIAGFVITGSAPKRVLLRAAGPSLSALGISGSLSDPVLELVSGTTIIQSNDNWGTEPDRRAEMTELFNSAGAFEWPAGSKDAALVATLAPGPYTALVRGAGPSPGVALVEAYELGTPEENRLFNISTRSLVRPGEQVQIAGFVIEGKGPKWVLVRASGPALEKYQVPGVLADPILRIQGVGVDRSNDDWDTSLWTEFLRLNVANWEVGSKDAALLLPLMPGAYTAIVSGKNGASGVALVEVFESGD